MLDNPELNIRFVGLVEAHPCLYDNTRDDYNINHIQQRAWSAIAKEIGEANVAECKNRWKNLRGSYTKHLNKYDPSGSRGTAKRPYYLAEYMYFITPFTKSRSAKGNTQTATKHTLDEELLTDALEVKALLDSKNKKNENKGNDGQENQARNKEVDQKASQDLTFCNQDDPLLENNTTAFQKQPRTGKKRVIHKSSAPLTENKRKRNKNIQSSITSENVNKSEFEYFEKKKQKSRGLSDISINDDADAHFLLSLLPDLKKMSDSQKRKFKVGIINFAGHILEETSSKLHSSAASTNNYSIIDCDMPLSRSSTASDDYIPTPIEETDSHSSYENILIPKLIYSTSEQHLLTNTQNKLYENEIS